MSRQDKEGRRRPPLLATGICLALVLLLSLCAPAFAAEPGSESGTLPAGITPVVLLSGSDYDMGYQYAQQTIAFCGTWFYEQTRGVYEPFSDQQIKALKAYQYYLMQYAPEMIEQFKGMAAGATASGLPMTYAEVLARQTGTRAFPGTEPPESADDTLPPSEGCAGWSAWGDTTTDGRLVAADSVDSSVGLGVITVAFPDVGNSYIKAGPVMNNKGVFFAHLALFAVRAQDTAPGYDAVDPIRGLAQPMFQHAARFCETAKQALDYYASVRPSTWGQDMFADVGGNGYVLERSAAFSVARQAGDFGEGDFITVRNNAFTNEGGEACLGGQPGRFYPHGGWALEPPAPPEDIDGFADCQMSSVRVNQTLFNMLTQYQGKVDANFDKMLWRFTGVMPKDPFSIEEFRATKAKCFETPFNLENNLVTIATPDNGPNGVMHVCSGPAGTVGSAYQVGPDDDYYRISGTHTFCELALAATPADVVQEAKLAAKFQQSRAYQELMYVPYGGLHMELTQLFDKAVSEYEEGENWQARAAKAGGNDQMLYLAQAATAFARAQCHAQQVYEALVKPPVTPSDLGLRRYRAISYGF